MSLYNGNSQPSSSQPQSKLKGLNGLASGKTTASISIRDQQHNAETLRLLDLSESSENELVTSNVNVNVNSKVPDLKLSMPTSRTDRALAAAGRIRRKIRLKR